MTGLWILHTHAVTVQDIKLYQVAVARTDTNIVRFLPTLFLILPCGM